MNRTARVGILGLLLLCTLGASDETRAWTFVSIDGLKIEIAFDPKDDVWSVTRYDITSGSPSCVTRALRHCFETTLLTSAFPVSLPKIGDTWSSRSATFEVLEIMGSLRVLDVELRDVYIVKAIHLDATFADPPQRKTYLLYVSGTAGLVAFQGTDPGMEDRVFIASSLPTLTGVD